MGPHYELSTTNLVFDTQPDVIVSNTIIVKNTGTCTLQYSWEKCEPITELQEERASNKFHLSNQSHGILLPKMEKEFSFSFISDIEGVSFI